MPINKMTFVPNEVFDQYLPYLTKAELKVLLIVLRQTLGWIDPKTKTRKIKDWITISFFAKKTKLTRKSISIALQGVVEKELIVILDSRNRELRTPKERRGKKKLYYAYASHFRAWKHQRSVKKISHMFTKRH